MENAIVRVPVARASRGRPAGQRPEAFTPDGEFILGPTDVRGFWVAAGFCAHGLAGAGGMGKLVAEWIVDGQPASTSGTWTRAASAPLPQPRVRAGADERGLRDLLRRQVPRARSARPGGRCGSRRPTRGCRSSAPRSARRPAGSGPNWFEPNAAGGDESLRRAAGPGSSGRPRSGPSTVACRETRRAVRRDLVRQARGLGRGRRRVPRAAVRQPRRPRGRRDHLHAAAERPRRDRVRLHRHPPRRGALPHRHRHRVRPARPRLAPRSTRREDGSVQVDDVTSRYACLGLWGRAPATSCSRSRPTTLATFPYMRAREIAVGSGAVPGAAGHLRRRARLGALLPGRVRSGPVGRDLGGRARARAGRGRLPGDRLAAAREGLPRLGRRHHARRHPVRGGPRLRREARQGRLPGPRRAAGGAGAAAPARVPRARRSALGRPRLGAGAHGRARSPAALPAAATATRSSARSRTPTCPAGDASGRPVEVEIFGRWVPGEVAAEPLYDPAGERIRA